MGLPLCSSGFVLTTAHAGLPRRPSTHEEGTRDDTTIPAPARSKNWHTFCAHPVRPRRSETCRNAPCYRTHFLLAHVRVVCSKLDGPMTLHELHRTMHLRHAADGRPRREVGKTAGLETFRQLFSDPSHLGLDHACCTKPYRLISPPL
eukprot:861417-Prymnesium_polylepis.1